MKNKVLKTAPVNWKKLKPIQGEKFKDLSPESYKKLKQSLLKNDFVTPFAVWEDKDKTIYTIDGVHRQKVLLELEKEGVDIPEGLPANFIECKNRKEASKMLLLYSSQYARVNQDGFNEFFEMEGLDIADIEGEVDIFNIDFDFNEPEVLENADDVPEVKDKAISQVGDIYLIGSKHRVMCGDSTKREDVEKLMDGGKCELCFTSPPYSDIRTYNDGKDISVGNLKGFIINAKTFCRYLAVNLGYKFKDGEIITYWDGYIQQAKDVGLKLLSWNVWDKMLAGSISNQSKMFAIEHEFIFVFGDSPKDLNRIVEKSPDSEKRLKHNRKDSKGRLVRQVRQSDGSMKYSTKGENYKFKNSPSVLQLPPNMVRDEASKKHPATFPIGLPLHYIETMTGVKDFIYDCFLGSGTTLIACEQTNRICYGMELDPIYIDVILKRYHSLYPSHEIKCINREVKIEDILND